MHKSAIWRHFTTINSENKVTCLHCPQQLSVANKSTCSLIRHLTKKHPAVEIRSSAAAEQVLLVDDDDGGNSRSPKGSNIIEYEIEEHEESENSIDFDQKPNINTKSKLKRKSVDQQTIAALSEAKRQISDALCTMKTSKRQNDIEDEYDHFGHVIASKIRKIQDMVTRETVMHSVYKAVYEALMKNV